MAAAYEKQQPQLNAAYYGPAIPPQAPPPPAYYGPPRGRYGRGPRCVFCCLFKVVALVVIALGAASLVLWLIFRPSAVKAYAESATLSRFDLAAGGGGGPRGRGGGLLLQYNLTVDIRVRNPNRFGIHYEYAEAQASYDGERFGFQGVQPFYLGSKSDGKIAAAFSGSSPVDDDDDVQRTYQRETREGFYFVKVKMYSDLGFKVRVFNIHDYKSKISCVLRLPVPNGNSTGMTTLGTKCDVDF